MNPAPPGGTAAREAVRPALGGWTVLDEPGFSEQASIIGKCGEGATARFRFGDAIVEVSADDGILLGPLDECYGECALDETDDGRPPLVRCRLWKARGWRLTRLVFADGATSHLATCVLSLLRPPPGDPPYAIWDADYAGWQYIGSLNAPVAAVGGRRLLFEMERVPSDFLPDLLAAVTLASQPGLMAIHAAALNVNEQGILLVGPSRAGKTTISLHLAARGHALLGDEVAALRLATGEALPIRRSIRLRPGPRGSQLSVALDHARMRDSTANGNRKERLRIGDLFPSSGAESVRLAVAFFMDGFAGRASVVPFHLSLDDTGIFDSLAANDIAFVSWGLNKETRALRLLALHRLLGRVPCLRLAVGDPDDTCSLIERTVEEIC